MNKANKNSVQDRLPSTIEEYYEDYIDGTLIEPHKIVLLEYHIKLTSLKTHKTSNKMCNENELVDATIVRKTNKKGEKNG